MSASFEIPLSASPQKFSIPLAGVSYNMTLKWCVPSAAWLLDVADDAGNALLSGVPLVTGADLLEQFEYLGIGGALYAETDFDPSAPPTFSNLGQTGHLYFVTP